MDEFGIISEYTTHKACQLARQLLAKSGIQSVVTYRITTAGFVFGVGVEPADVERAKKLLDSYEERPTRFYNWYDENE